MIVALSIYVLLAQAMTPEAIEHTQAGMEAQKQGHFDQAIEEFKKVIAASPEMPSAYANLGIAYFKMGNYEQAIPALEQSLKLNPKLLGVHQALGVALLIRETPRELCRTWKQRASQRCWGWLTWKRDD